LSYTATYNDWGTLVYWAIVTRDFTGRLLWHVLLAAGASLTLLTLGFHLLAIGFRRAAAKPWSSLPLEPVGQPVPPERIVPEAVPIS
jgi:ABC-type dipeptide/oligopeptide/nickel transport system permease subunit